MGFDCLGLFGWIDNPIADSCVLGQSVAVVVCLLCWSLQDCPQVSTESHLNSNILFAVGRSGFSTDKTDNSVCH